jgi:hypothetical protein
MQASQIDAMISELDIYWLSQIAGIKILNLIKLAVAFYDYVMMKILFVINIILIFIFVLSCHTIFVFNLVLMALI